MYNKILEIQKYKRGISDVFMCNILKSIKGKTASELLEIYNISLNPPVNLTELLQKLGISAVEFDFSGLEEYGDYEFGSILGATISSDDNLTIFYRKDDSENRKRFTIAHELAHCCLHSKNLKQNHIEFRNNDNYFPQKEIEANIFAGELLIPEESLEKIYNELLVPSLSTLAEVFGVSSNVMAARLDYLNKPYLKDTKYSYS